MLWPASWSSGQSLCLLIMRSRVRFPVLPWEFSLKGRIPAVSMVWVGWYNLSLRALLAIHPPISPLTSSGQRNRASWASQTQKSVTLLPCPGGKTTKSTRTCAGIGGKKKKDIVVLLTVITLPINYMTFCLLVIRYWHPCPEFPDTRLIQFQTCWIQNTITKKLYPCSTFMVIQIVK